MKQTTSKKQVLLNATDVDLALAKAQELHAAGDPAFPTKPVYAAQAITSIINNFVEGTPSADKHTLDDGSDHTGNEDAAHAAFKPAEPGAEHKDTETTLIELDVEGPDAPHVLNAPKDQGEHNTAAICVASPSSAREAQGGCDVGKDAAAEAQALTCPQVHTSVQGVVFASNRGDVIAIVDKADRKTVGRLLKYHGFTHHHIGNVQINLCKHLGADADSEAVRLAGEFGGAAWSASAGI